MTWDQAIRSAGRRWAMPPGSPAPPLSSPALQALSTGLGHSGPLPILCCGGAGKGCSGGPQAPCPAGRTLASSPQGPSAHPALSSIILGNETHTPSPDLLEAGLCSFLGRAMPCAQPHPQSPAWTASLQFFQIFLPSGVSKFKTSPWDLQGKSSHCPGFRVGPLRAFVY